MIEYSWDYVLLYIVILYLEMNQAVPRIQASGILRWVLDFWFNGCFDDICEFGVFSRSLNNVDVGVSFLSIYSLYYPLKYIDLYDLQNMARFRIDMSKIRVYDISFSRVIGENVEVLGYQLRSDHWIKPFLKIKEIYENIIQNLRSIHASFKTVLRLPKCYEDRIRLRRNNSTITISIQYKCDSLRDYEELYKLILLYKLLSGKIHKINTIVKPVWKAKLS